MFVLSRSNDKMAKKSAVANQKSSLFVPVDAEVT